MRRKYPATGAGASADPVVCWSCRYRAPASAGARNLKVRGHLHPLVPRRGGKLTEIDDGCAARAHHPPLLASHPPHPPHAPIPHLPAALHRPRAALHASLAPHPLWPSCAQELNFALLPRPGSRAARRGGAAAVAQPVWAGRALGRPGGGRWGSLGVCRGASKVGRQEHKNGWLQWGDFFVPLVDKSYPSM